MRHLKINKMVQGAMIAAMYGALSLFNTYTGSMFDIFICYMMVIPIVWYGYTYTIKDNLIVVLVSMIVIFMFGLPFFIISALSSCLMGVYIGACLQRKTNKGEILLGSFIVALLNNIMLYEVLSGLVGVNLVSEMSEMYQMMAGYYPAITTTLPLTTFLQFIPLLLILTSLVEIYIIVVFCQLVLRRLKVEFPGTFHIASLHFDLKVGIILAVGMFGSSLIKNFFGYQHIILDYIYLLSMMGFVADGLSTASLYLISKNKGRLSGLLFLSLILPFASMAYTILGILDIFGDIREKLLYNMNNYE